MPAPHGNNGGELDRVALDDDGYGHYQAHVLQRYALTNCSPGGLALDTETGVAAVGCAGGRQILWNVRTSQVTASLAIPGVDIVAATDHFFFFPSYLKQTPTITNEQGRIVQTIKTSAQSHTVTADATSGQVFVPLDGGKVMVRSTSGKAMVVMSPMHVWRTARKNISMIKHVQVGIHKRFNVGMI